jgi:hypothetical protein
MTLIPFVLEIKCPSVGIYNILFIKWNVIWPWIAVPEIKWPWTDLDLISSLKWKIYLIFTLKYCSSIVLELIVFEFESPSLDLDAISVYKSNVLEMTLIPFVLEIKRPSVGIYTILFFKWNVLWLWIAVPEIKWPWTDLILILSLKSKIYLILTLKYCSSIVLELIVLEFESPSFDLDAIWAYKSNVLEMTLIPFVLEIKCPSVGFDVILFSKRNVLWPWIAVPEIKWPWIEPDVISSLKSKIYLILTLKYCSWIVLDIIVLEFESPSFGLDAILAYKSIVLEMTLIHLSLKSNVLPWDLISFCSLNGMSFDLGLLSLESNDLEPSLISFRPWNERFI